MHSFITADIHSSCMCCCGAPEIPLCNVYHNFSGYICRDSVDIQYIIYIYVC